MRLIAIIGLLYSLLFSDTINPTKAIDIYSKSVHAHSYIRNNIDISPYEASKYIGGYAIVYYQYGNKNYTDTLYFIRYDNQSKKILGMRKTTEGILNPMACAKYMTNEYQLFCAAQFSQYSENADWYYLNFNGTNISGDYYFGTPDEAAYVMVNAKYSLKPLYGTFYPKNNYNFSSSNSSSSNYASNTDSSSSVCIPGLPCDESSTSSSSSISQNCESQIKYGSEEDYENGTANLPGTPKIVYTKEVVDQIIENKLSKCRQDPKSCGINAIPIITTKSDPNKVINQIKNKEFSINGHYIHYGEGGYEWIYIPSSLKSIYKLEKGVDENYNLRWLLIDSVKAIKNGDKITFTTP
ncbi:hypothetical protein [Nitratiruptor sp. YY09-18]|uniref:hypothetical protein n=1 Tax=Nitratiruptor sp. YY09-18 TaxID=2724901 RepID=UPI001915D862|nr:hypothetical protein [Nitratiruptor sp. YY09-18]BCD67342.1 hypothetical protein NitYY0918_C0226 [Nitratiruptor sp. YY09-18]